jgi:hypothetical protein
MGEVIDITDRLRRRREAEQQPQIVTEFRPVREDRGLPIFNVKGLPATFHQQGDAIDVTFTLPLDR